MNIDNLTYGELKQMAATLSASVTAPGNSLLKAMVGKYVIIRSRNEGINAGEVVEADETGVIIKNARRIWYHAPADTSLSWYEGVAISGLSSDSKISGTVPCKVIIEDYSMTLCSDEARESIQGAKTHAQN